MAHFGEFLKTWSLLSNSVTRQVSFSTTKIGRKCQNSNATFWVIFKQFSSLLCSFRNSRNLSLCFDVGWLEFLWRHKCTDSTLGLFPLQWQFKHFLRLLFSDFVTGTITHINNLSQFLALATTIFSIFSAISFFQFSLTTFGLSFEEPIVFAFDVSDTFFRGFH